MFHLSIPTRDLEGTEKFYKNVFGVKPGRRTDSWVDLDFFGHQVTFHLIPDYSLPIATNPVDKDNVPLPHFGVVLEIEDWYALRDRVQQHDIDFIINPTVRFKGQVGEQRIMFFYDNNRYPIEIKGFCNMDQVFNHD